jgi:putative DNA primase/helicase
MPDGQPPDDPIIRLEQVRKQKQAPKGNDPDAALEGTEDEVALEFSRRHAKQLRYVNLWHKWLQWNSARWELVETLWVFHQVRLVAREYAKLHDDTKLGKDAATAAIERTARNDRRHDTPSDAWDIDPRLFNTPDRRKPL